MGKSLSIVAITVSIYNINGYAPGQPIGDDYPLDPSLEKLRAKLIHRQTPLSTALNIRKVHSRQLLTGTEKKSFTTVMDKWFEDGMDSEQNQLMILQEFGGFRALFMQQLQSMTTSKTGPDADTISQLQKSYRRLAFHPYMLQFIQLIRNHHYVNPDEYDILAKLLSNVLFDHEVAASSTSFITEKAKTQQSLMLTLQNICKQLLVHPEDIRNKWTYSKLYQHAITEGLLPEVSQIDVLFTEYTELNNQFLKKTIIFNTGFIIPWKLPDVDNQIWALSGRQLLSVAKYLIPIQQYPYLVTNAGYWIVYEFLLHLLEGDPEFYDTLNPDILRTDEQEVINLFRDALIKCFEEHAKEDAIVEFAKKDAQQMGELLNNYPALKSLLTQDMSQECLDFWFQQ